MNYEKYHWYETRSISKEDLTSAIKTNRIEIIVTRVVAQKER